MVPKYWPIMWTILLVPNPSIYRPIQALRPSAFRLNQTPIVEPPSRKNFLVPAALNPGIQGINVPVQPFCHTECLPRTHGCIFCLWATQPGALEGAARPRTRTAAPAAPTAPAAERPSPSPAAAYPAAEERKATAAWDVFTVIGLGPGEEIWQEYAHEWQKKRIKIAFSDIKNLEI
jgi:hypothetical protein